MFSKIRPVAAIFALVFVSSQLLAQGSKLPVPPAPKPAPPAPTPKVVTPPAPDRSVVAATVNGQVIREVAVYRAMLKIPPKFWESARPEILSYLIETTLIDQYLERLKTVDASFKLDQKEIQGRLKQVEDELKKNKQTLDDLLKRLHLTKAELREQIVGAVRWEKFMNKYAPEAKLKEMFTKQKNMFDDSLVRARHLLIKPKSKSKEDLQKARFQAAQLKQQIEAQAAEEVVKIPATADKLDREKARRDALEKAFGDVAGKSSDCPSKKNGGELGYFPRLGKMVEPFALAAFATPVFQITEPVQTEFGYHLIMPTDQKPGKDVTFKQVRHMVQGVYAEQLREAILRQMRPKAKIQVTERKKTK